MLDGVIPSHAILWGMVGGVLLQLIEIGLCLLWFQPWRVKWRELR